MANNLLGGFGAGFSMGQGVVDRSRQMQDHNRLASLASQAYTTPADQQSSLLGQMAQVSPQFAQGHQDRFQQQGDRKEQRLADAAKYLLSAFERGDQAAIQGAYRTVLPEFQQLAEGRQLPETVDDSILPMLHQVIAAAGGGSGGQGVQSTYVDDQGQRVAIMRDGSTRVLGGNDAGATQQTITINGPDGRPAQYTFNRRTGNYEPATLGGGGVPQQQGQPQMQQVQYATDDGQPIPANEQAAAQAAFAASARGESFDFPVGGPMPQAPQGRSPFVGRAPEEQAALTEAAKEQVQLGFLPQRQAIETQGAIERTRGTEQAKADVDKAKGRAKAKLSLDQATSRLQRVDSLVQSIIPRINRMTAGWVGDKLSGVAGTDAADLRRDIGTLQAIAGFDELNAMRAASPTGGALGNVTERELAFLQSVIRNIENSQSPEQLRRNLQAFQGELRGSWERVNQAYQQDYSGENLDHIPPMSDFTGQGGGQQAPSAGGWGIERVK